MAGAVADSGFRCIECGCKEPELFHSYCDGVVKVMHCSSCRRLVDKYIEYDSIVIFLDAMLHKSQAYRHLLFNISIPSPWKLALIYLLCDTYIQWQDIETKRQRPIIDDYIFYAALEWDVYIIFLVVLLQWLLLTIVVVFLMSIARLLKQSTSNKPTNGLVLVHRSLVVSSFAKLLAIPAVIWAQTHSAIYLMFTELLVFTSNVSAVRVLPGASLLESVFILSFAHTMRKFVGNTVLQRLYGV